MDRDNHNRDQGQAQDTRILQAVALGDLAEAAVVNPDYTARDREAGRTEVNGPY